VTDDVGFVMKNTGQNAYETRAQANAFIGTFVSVYEVLAWSVTLLLESRRHFVLRCWLIGSTSLKV